MVRNDRVQTQWDEFRQEAVETLIGMNTAVGRQCAMSGCNSSATKRCLYCRNFFCSQCDLQLHENGPAFSCLHPRNDFRNLQDSAQLHVAEVTLDCPCDANPAALSSFTWKQSDITVDSLCEFAGTLANLSQCSFFVMNSYPLPRLNRTPRSAVISFCCYIAFITELEFPCIASRIAFVFSKSLFSHSIHA